MRRTLGLCLAAALMVQTACVIAPVVPPIGGVFNNTRAPMDVDFEDTQLGSKVGKSSTTSVLGLFAWGDASIAAAARDGGITTVRHADYEYLNVIGIYTSFTTVVRGD